MITKLNSRFGVNYEVTTKKDLVEFARNYLNEDELNEMLSKVKNYKNYERVQDGYLGIERLTERTYLVELY